MTFEEFNAKIQTQYDENNCPVTKVLDLLNGKWTTRLSMNWNATRAYALEN